MTKTKALQIANVLIDDRCQMYGVRNTIAYLIDFLELTRGDLIELSFDEDDVDYVINNLNEFYDLE